MSRLLCPILLTVGVAFPGAALALGLGDLHVESTLGQSFMAHIDLIDASHEELARLNATIADEDVFQRYQLERPGFLTGTTVTLGQDAHGQPILSLRSRESVTEPAVTFLVDVHWRGGELIREYTALLDPAELAERAPAAASATAPKTALEAPPVAEVAAAADRADRKPQLRSYTVAPGDTLSHIASAAGARARKAHYRMMIAIYRANPSAFQTDFNALRSGAVLRLPSAEELAAISPAQAEREYQAQRATRRATNHHRLHARAGEHASRAAEPSKTSVTAAAAESGPGAGSLEAERAALAHRVESLEQSVQQLRWELQQRNQHAAAPLPVAAATAPATTANGTEALSAPPSYDRASFIVLASALGLTTAVTLWWMRRRKDDDVLASWHRAPDVAIAEEPPTSARIDTGQTTAILPPEIEAPGDAAEHKFSFYDPGSHADTLHVVMGSELTRPLAFVERRKNPAIVLQQAIEREPYRSELYLKLLELYYASASENRLAFLEATRQILQKPGLVCAEEWARIADMGRRIAPEEALFASPLDDQAVA